MLKRKKTKIVATLGPATNSKEILKAMLDEGVNVFRINFSHADYNDVKERIKMIRELTNLGLKQCKDLIDALPNTVMEGVSKGEADAALKLLEEAGATIEIK